MLISPSIASADLLRIAEEVEFIDTYFDNIHLDIADGVAVQGITFGMKLCKDICKISKSRLKSIHLEVCNPLVYIDDVKECKADICFIQTDCLENPVEIIKEYQNNGIKTGANISNLDLDKPYLKEIIDISEEILVNTTYHCDTKQILKKEMLEYACSLSDHKKIYIDGGVKKETLELVKSSNIYCAIMGRAVFNNKNQIIIDFDKGKNFWDKP